MISKPTGELRFIIRNGMRILQQEFEDQDFSRPRGEQYVFTKWRDVPLVDDEETRREDMAETIKADQRRMRRWTPEEDAIIAAGIREKLPTGTITSRINANSPDNVRTENAVYQRIFKIRAGLE